MGRFEDFNDGVLEDGEIVRNFDGESDGTLLGTTVREMEGLLDGLVDGSKVGDTVRVNFGPELGLDVLVGAALGGDVDFGTAVVLYVGALVGFLLGEAFDELEEGEKVGRADGVRLGEVDGTALGKLFALIVGLLEGVMTAFTVDASVGAMDGGEEVTVEGETIGAVEEALDGIALEVTTAQMASVVAATTIKTINN